MANSTRKRRKERENGEIKKSGHAGNDGKVLDVTLIKYCSILLLYAELTKTISICEGEHKNMSCSDGGKIQVVFANFGRLDDHTCPHVTHDYQSDTDCRAQVSRSSAGRVPG